MTGAAMRIVYWARLPFARELIVEEFGAIAEIEFIVCASLEECVAALPGTDGLVLYNAREADARKVIAGIVAAGRLRWMHFLTAGREGFEAAGIPPHIAVTQSAGASAPVVAEHAIALLLALARGVPAMLAQARERRWDRGIAARCSSLEGGTMAIVGYGRIGCEIARRARAFGMRVIALSRSGKADALTDEAHRLDALHAVLARADVVISAIALTPATRHLLDRAALRACRPGAILVNVARGGVIDQAALCEALTGGSLGGAGLDVTDPEPPGDDDPLWDCPNLIVSPHIAVEGSPATARRLADGAMHTLRRFLAGQDLQRPPAEEQGPAIAPHSHFSQGAIA
jgi:phosphoglycerate dehydrogenase-like enzyme